MQSIYLLCMQPQLQQIIEKDARTHEIGGLIYLFSKLYELSLLN